MSYFCNHVIIRKGTVFLQYLIHVIFLGELRDLLLLFFHVCNFACVQLSVGSTHESVFGRLLRPRWSSECPR